MAIRPGMAGLFIQGTHPARGHDCDTSGLPGWLAHHSRHDRGLSLGFSWPVLAHHRQHSVVMDAARAAPTVDSRRLLSRSPSPHSLFICFIGLSMWLRPNGFMSTAGLWSMAGRWASSSEWPGLGRVVPVRNPGPAVPLAAGCRSANGRCLQLRRQSGGYAYLRTVSSISFLWAATMSSAR